MSLHLFLNLHLFASLLSPSRQGGDESPSFSSDKQCDLTPGKESEGDIDEGRNHLRSVQAWKRLLIDLTED